MRLGWLATGVMLGCGAPADVAPPASVGLTGALMASTIPESPPAEPGTPLHHIQLLGREALIAVHRCRDEAAAKLTGWTPAAGPVPLTVDQLQGSCAEVGPIFERYTALLGYRYRETLQAYTGLARVYEDVRILDMAIREDWEDDLMLGAVDHLRRSVVEEDRGFLESVRASVARDLDAPPAVEQVDAAQYLAQARLAITAAENDLGGMHRAVRNFAFGQGADHRMVRARFLKHFGDWGTAEAGRLRVRLAALAHEPLPAVDAAMGTLVDAVEGYSAAWHRAAGPYLVGPVLSSQPLRDDEAAAWARFEAAAAAARAAVGG